MKLNISIDGIKFGTDLATVEVPTALRSKRPSGFEAWDDALGGKGITPSMITYFTGVSGGGKTTLLMQTVDGYIGRGNNVLYNTGEESGYQLKMTWERLRLRNAPMLGQITSCPTLLAQADYVRAQDPEKPFILIVDSLQAMHDGKFKNGRITTATAERVMQQLTNWAKTPLEGVPDDVAFPNVIVIGQVTKGGKMAGSNKIKHMIDAHVHMSIETQEDSAWFDCRKLFTTKNRFGGAGQLTFLRMGARGLTAVGKVESDLTGG